MILNNQEDWIKYKNDLDSKARSLQEHRGAPDKYPAKVNTVALKGVCTHRFEYENEKADE